MSGGISNWKKKMKLTHKGWYLWENPCHKAFQNSCKRLYSFSGKSNHPGSLSEIMPLGNPQSASNRRSNRAFAHIGALYVDFPGINATCFDALHVTVNMASSSSNNVRMKFIAMVQNKIVDFLMNINFP